MRTTAADIFDVGADRPSHHSAIRRVFAAVTWVVSTLESTKSVSPSEASRSRAPLLIGSSDACCLHGVLTADCVGQEPRGGSSNGRPLAGRKCPSGSAFVVSDEAADLAGVGKIAAYWFAGDRPGHRRLADRGGLSGQTDAVPAVYGHHYALPGPHVPGRPIVVAFVAGG